MPQSLLRQGSTSDLENPWLYKNYRVVVQSVAEQESDALLPQIRAHWGQMLRKERWGHRLEEGQDWRVGPKMAQNFQLSGFLFRLCPNFRDSQNTKEQTEKFCELPIDPLGYKFWLMGTFQTTFLSSISCLLNIPLLPLAAFQLAVLCYKKSGLVILARLGKPNMQCC